MNQKSHVGTGYYLCPVCGNKHSDIVLLDRRMKDTLTQNMFMGMQMCPEDQAHFDKGFIALIECTNPDEDGGSGKRLKNEDASRTGRIFHMKKEAVQEIFRVSEENLQEPFMFITEKVGEMLTNLMEDLKQQKENEVQSQSQEQ